MKWVDPHLGRISGNNPDFHDPIRIKDQKCGVKQLNEKKVSVLLFSG
jgi:hypothetical protein